MLSRDDALKAMTGERFVGLLHLGEVFEPKPAPERPDAAAAVTYLD